MNGIIVLKMKTTDKTEGGIILAKEKQLDEATVVAVGPGEWVLKKGNKKPEFRKVGVNVDDNVVIGPGSGVTLEVDIDQEKELLTFIAETDIVAIIRKENVV